MTSTPELIYLIDDELSIRESLAGLLESLKFKVLAFESAAAFLSHRRRDDCSCMILDVQLPDLNGLELQKRLIDEESMPIIFISGRGDIPTTVKAMKAGAVDFLTKPVDETALVETVRTALARDRKLRQKRAEVLELRKRFNTLTPRERQVYPMLVAGMLNKQIAFRLGIAEVTIQVHRGQLMRKMAADSFADLVRMAARLGIKRYIEDQHTA
jgi:FixJ family two-component response regulator